MATVYRKANSPFYYAQFFDRHGKRISRSTRRTKKREAQAEAQRLEVEEKAGGAGGGMLPKAYSVIVEDAARAALAGELTLARAEELVMRLHRLANPDFEVVTLDQHLQAWVERQSIHVGRSTCAVYEDMRRHVIAAVGPRAAAAPVGHLTADQVRKAVQVMREKGLRASTCNMHLRALRRALQTAVIEGLAKANVASPESVRVLKESDSSHRAPFTADEVRAMIEQEKTSDEWRGCILIGAHTGMRMGDVVSLQRNNVVGDRLVVAHGKTGKSVVCPISPQVRQWVGARTGALFPTLSTRSRGTLSTAFKGIMRRAGVADRVELPSGEIARRSYHSLRHTFTSWLAEADVQADVRQKLTGHSSAGIHARYTHHDEALDRAVAALPVL
jgi:integrase